MTTETDPNLLTVLDPRVPANPRQRFAWVAASYGLDDPALEAELARYLRQKIARILLSEQVKFFLMIFGACACSGLGWVVILRLLGWTGLRVGVASPETEWFVVSLGAGMGLLVAGGGVVDSWLRQRRRAVGADIALCRAAFRPEAVPLLLGRRAY